MQNFFVPNSPIFVTATAAFVTLKRSQAFWPFVCIFRDCETYAIHKKQDECTDSEFSPDVLSAQSF